MEIEKAFFVLEHGSYEGIAVYLDAIKTIKDECPIVVRCKDCDLWQEEHKVGSASRGNISAPCAYWSGEGCGTWYTTPSDFCSHGGRKDGAE